MSPVVLSIRPCLMVSSQWMVPHGIIPCLMVSPQNSVAASIRSGLCIFLSTVHSGYGYRVTGSGDDFVSSVYCNKTVQFVFNLPEQKHPTPIFKTAESNWRFSAGTCVRLPPVSVPGTRFCHGWYTPVCACYDRVPVPVQLEVPVLVRDPVGLTMA